MSKSRRAFLINSSFAILGSATAAYAQVPTAADQKPAEATPGAPSAFGGAPPVGPQVSPATFAEAERLVQVSMTEKDRAQAAQNWRNNMASGCTNADCAIARAQDPATVPLRVDEVIQ